ncbi:MAG: RNA pyrophosphohydrolase [SAR324 cluster bacterium]|nr:RNA pyrophosphohydrolase [SAR324 cluster bacterium]
MYRSNVCIVIINKARTKVLMFRRIGATDYCWQFPQGGVDDGESEIEAFCRELKEEIGTNDVKLIKVSQKRIKYEFPEWVLEKMAEKGIDKSNFKGQKQRWFLVQLNRGLKSIRFDHEPAEFDACTWVTPDKVLEKIVPFKRKAYQRGLHSLDIL